MQSLPGIGLKTAHKVFKAARQPDIVKVQYVVYYGLLIYAKTKHSFHKLFTVLILYTSTVYEYIPGSASKSYHHCIICVRFLPLSSCCAAFAST